MLVRIVVLCVTLMLFGCVDGKGNENPGKADATGCEEMRGYRPLPDGIVLPMPHQMRSDEFYRSKSGSLRRRVMLEILSADFNQSVESTERALQSAGYVASVEVEGKRESHVLKFKKKKSPTLSVMFSRKAGKKAVHPEADHLITISWKAEVDPSARIPGK